MAAIVTLIFLGCCTLAVLVAYLFGRVQDLKREIEWHRRHVHDLATRVEWFERRVATLPAAPATPKPAEPEPAPVVARPVVPPAPVVPPPRPPEPVRPPAPVHPVAPPLPRPEIGVVHHRPAPPPPPPAPPPPPPRPVPHPPVPARPPAPVVAAASPSEAKAPPVTPPPPPHHPPPVHVEPAPHKPRADLEFTLGTRWLSRIGIIAVLAGLVFGVWLLYDMGIIVITREMVIGAGLLLGLGLMVGAEFAHRRGYEPQSEALTGGGAAILYLTLWVGLHVWPILGASFTFLAMALVTAGAASQALRHESQTIAVLTWVVGYLVPLLIGERQGGGGAGDTSAYALFIYLTLLSCGVFVVAQRRAWPVFTGLSLMGAHAGAAYIFRVSHGSLGWTLSYLLLITAGMMWVAITRREKEGANYGVLGAIAGYLITGVAMLAGGHGPLYAPYLYLLALSGALLILGRALDWPVLRWCAVIGGLVGLLLLYQTGAPQLGNWLLLYAALSVAGSFVSSSGRRESAEPLAITSALGAYGAAALFVWSPSARSISPEALFAYLALLAGGLLYVGVRQEWTWLPIIGSVAAFCATGLLYQQVPHGGLAVYPLAYLVLLSIAVIGVATWFDDDWLAGIGIAGAFVGLPLTGVFGWEGPTLLVPAYLGVAAVAALAVIERRKWFGQEWLPLAGVWVLYGLWRVIAQRLDPTPGDLAYTIPFVLIFLGASWVRHGVRVENAMADNSIFMVLNALAFFGIGWWDVSRLPSEWLTPGVLALSLFALYLVAGVAAVKRCPEDTCFGPVLIGLAVLFVTFAPPLIFHGCAITAAWSLEGAILMALGFHYRNLSLRVGSLIVLAVGLLRTVGMDNLVEREGYQVLLNSRALGTGALIAALYVCSCLYARLRERVGDGEDWLSGGLTGLATVLLWWVVSAETWCWTGWQLGLGAEAQHFALSAAWIIFAGALIQIGILRGVSALRWCRVGLLALTAIKVFAVDPPLTEATYVLVFNSHSLPLVFIAGLLGELVYVHFRRGDEEAPILAICGGLLLFWVCCSETWMYLGWVAHAGRGMQQLGLSMVWLIFGAGAWSAGMVRRNAAFRWLGVVLFALTLGKVFLIDPPLARETYFPIANSHTFPLLIIAAVLYGMSAWYFRLRLELPEAEVGLARAFPVMASVLVWWMLTTEAWRFTGWVLNGSPIAQQYALSAVWTLFAAALVTVGLIRRRALYRWTAMTLFALTIVKVFIFDLASLSLPFRVLAFMGLGAVLIAVSFGYQRLVRGETRES